MAGMEAELHWTYVTYVTYTQYTHSSEPAMPITADFDSFTAARTHLKQAFDANAHGRTVTLRRDDQLSAMLPVERLRAYFVQTVSPRVRVFREDGRVIALMEDRPFVSEGATIDDALVDLVLSLREYAEDWEARLQQAPNHAQSWALVQLVKLSSDEQLLDWLDNGGE